MDFHREDHDNAGPINWRALPSMPGHTVVRDRTIRYVLEVSPHIGVA